MYTSQEIKNMTDTLWGELMKKISEVAAVRVDSVKRAMKNHKKLNEEAADWRDAVESVVGAVNYEGRYLPKFISKVTTDGDTVSVIVRTKLASPYKFRSDAEFKLNADIVSQIGHHYADALVRMLHIEIARENVSGLNAVLAVLAESAESDITLEFDCIPDENAGVCDIDDNKVVVNIGVAEAHSIPSLGIMKDDEDGYSAIIKEESQKEFINAIKTATTVAQLVKLKTPVLTELAGFSARRSSARLIKNAFHRQAQYLKTQKSGSGYYDETVDIGGEKVHVFAAVNKAEDGTMSVRLSPFDVATGLKVDFDVLAAIA